MHDSPAVSATPKSNYHTDKSLEDSEKTARVLNVLITLTSCDVKALDKVSKHLICGARDKKLTVNGPIPMPTKVLSLTTRKSPCGNGTNTFDKFEMRIHKRMINLHSPAEYVKQITFDPMEHGVKIQFRIKNT